MVNPKSTLSISNHHWIDLRCQSSGSFVYEGDINLKRVQYIILNLKQQNLKICLIFSYCIK